jgi:uncharacterized protein
VKRDPKAAIATLEAAAKAGNSDAARRLIGLYRSGSGKILRPDVAKAKAALAAYSGLLNPTQLVSEQLLLQAADASNPADYAALTMAYRAAPQSIRIGILTGLRSANANAFIYIVQDELKRRGIYDGPLHGTLTRRTISAIKTLCDAGPSSDMCRLGVLTGDAARLIAVRVAGG